MRLELEERATSESLPARFVSGIDVLWTPVRIGKCCSKEQPLHQMLFTCRDLPFGEVIPRGAEVHERLRPATNMIFGFESAPAEYVENNLLMVVGSTEVLHRNLGLRKRQLDPNEFRVLREKVLGATPEEHKEWVKSQLRNQVTLRERLRDLVNRLDRGVAQALVPNVELWARRTVQARNALTHEGRTQRHEIEELAAMVEVTHGVTVLNLLTELGLSAPDLCRAVRENPKLRRAAYASTRYFS